MSDQLAKIDPYIEGLVHKIVKYIHGILDPEDQVRQGACSCSVFMREDVNSAVCTVQSYSHACKLPNTL